MSSVIYVIRLPLPSAWFPPINNQPRLVIRNRVTSTFSTCFVIVILIHATNVDFLSFIAHMCQCIIAYATVIEIWYHLLSDKYYSRSCRGFRRIIKESFTASGDWVSLSLLLVHHYSLVSYNVIGCAMLFLDKSLYNVKAYESRIRIAFQSYNIYTLFTDESYVRSIKIEYNSVRLQLPIVNHMDLSFWNCINV